MDQYGVLEKPFDNATNEEIKKAYRDVLEKYSESENGSENAGGEGYYQTQPQTQTPAFKKWFGDSKVVDENGKPLVVYHGTGADFDIFDANKIGSNFNQSTLGFYFTNAPQFDLKKDFGYGSTASEYAENAKGNPNVMPVYLSIKNPLLLDASGWEGIARYIDLNNNDIKNWIKSGEHDGVIAFDKENSESIYIALKSEQIKSAISNQGTFDPNNANIYYQSAFHGTPYKFDKFTLDNIGRGEGVQAYGWGLYFAGDRAVAEWYRNKLSSGLKVKGLFGKSDFNTKKLKSDKARSLYSFQKPDPEIAIEELEKQKAIFELFQSPDIVKQYAPMIEDLKHDINLLKKVEYINTGQLYEVNIPEVDDMLDWDDMLSRQPPNIQEAVKKAFDQIPQEDVRRHLGYKNADDIYELSGGDLYFILSTMGMSKELPSSFKDYSRGDEGASKFLYANGIKGIKYFDGNSRNKKEGQHNYVVFDDAAIDIVKTYYQTAPTFYSALEKQITDLPQGKGSPEQWAGIIKNLTQKGVKQEELDWTGVEDWIKEQKGSVTKEQILDYLKANKIEVEEVVKGDKRNEKQKAALDLKDLGITIAEFPDGTNFYNEEGDEIYPEEFTPKQKEATKRYYEAKDETKSITKFEKYTLAGGENYRELLLTLPEKSTTLPELFKDEESGEWVAKQDGKELGRNVNLRGLRNSLGLPPGAATDNRTNYRTTHFDEPNILAHIRFNERTDKDGARVMFVEELQSDWHQEGRKKGYKSKIDVKNWKAEYVKPYVEKIGGQEYDRMGSWSVYNEKGQLLRTINDYSVKTEQEAIQQVLKFEENKGVPDAPFKTTWNELAFKRALLWAVENNFDKVAWTTGEQQAERYDLSKQVDRVIYTSDGRLIAIKPDGDEVIDKAVSENEIEDYVGKEVARKLLESKPDKDGAKELDGENLKVGGEGMKAFYDKIVPSMVNKLAKKFGGKVEVSNIKEAGDVWSLEITPAMRESIQKQGLPLFQNELTPQGQTEFIGKKPIISLFETADRSTLLHELGHVFLQIQSDLSKLPNMSQSFIKDWQITQKWLGVKNGVITREAHEKFARGFEAYLREGKAPSIGLRDAFNALFSGVPLIYLRSGTGATGACSSNSECI